MRVKGEEEMGAALKRVKEQTRKTPQGGLGYGLLRYTAPAELRERAKRLPRGAVSLNYVGRQQSRSVIYDAEKSSGAGRSPRAPRFYEIDVNAGIDGGRLWMSVAYSRERYERATIERLLSAVDHEFVEMVEHCVRHGGYTPSDFPLAALSQESLDELVDEITIRHGGTHPLIDNIYPLSHMQQGMLFHSVLDPNSGVYFVQHSSRLWIEDVGAFRRAWEWLVRRHAVLRTGFEWEQDEPLQVVYRDVELPWLEEDWRGVEAGAWKERLAELLEQDQREGFDLSRAPLTRVRLIRLADDEYHVVWSYHHLLLDGWATARLLDELMRSYDAFRRGDRIALAFPRPFSDYIEWLGGRDLAEAEAFWRDKLRGFTAPTRMPMLASSLAAGSDDPSDYVREYAMLSPPTAAAIDDVAAQYQLTLNTLIQGAWALTLSHYCDALDIVFGATVAGRPPDLRGVENIIGLFINTLPVRVRVIPDCPLMKWLQALQAEQADSRQYDYASLTQIHGWSELARNEPLFDTIVVIDNYASKNVAEPNAPDAP